MMQILEVKPVLGMVLGNDQDPFRGGTSELPSHLSDLIPENGRGTSEVDFANIIEPGWKQIAIHRSDLVPRVPEVDGAVEGGRRLAETRVKPLRYFTSFFEDGVSDLIF